MTNAIAVFSLIRRYWWIAALAILAGLYLDQRATIARMDGKLQHASDIMALTKERIGHAQAAAEAQDRRHAMDVAARQETVNRKVADDLEAKLAQARAAAAAHARADRVRARSGAAQGGVGQPDLPAAANAAGGADAADQTAELDDVACAEAVTIAEGWQVWALQQGLVPRWRLGVQIARRRE